MESSATASLHSIPNLTLSTSPSFEDDNMVQCPTCDTKLHRFEVAKHCEQEMQRLKDLNTHALADGPLPEEAEVKGEDESATSNGQSTSEKRKPWSVFQRVQRNRQSRMKVRTITL